MSSTLTSAYPYFKDFAIASSQGVYIVTSLDWLYSGTNSNNSDLLQYRYRLSNGLYIAIIANLLLAALPYINKSNNRSLFRAFFITYLAFRLFVFYGLFFNFIPN